MHASLTLVSLLAAGALGLVAPKQQPLEDQSISSSKLDLIYEYVRIRPLFHSYTN